MKRFILLLFLAIFELSYSQDAIFKPFRKLYTIQTEKFEIIFPIESRRTAEKLSEFVDEIYEEYSKILNSKVDGKIPITITADMNIFNAWSTPLPYPAMVLFDTMEDGNTIIDSDNFKGTFIHELTH